MPQFPVSIHRTFVIRRLVHQLSDTYGIQMIQNARECGNSILCGFVCVEREIDLFLFINHNIGRTDRNVSRCV